MVQSDKRDRGGPRSEGAGYDSAESPADSEATWRAVPREALWEAAGVPAFGLYVTESESEASGGTGSEPDWEHEGFGTQAAPRSAQSRALDPSAGA